MNQLLRKIPKVDEVLKAPGWAELVDTYPEIPAKEALRTFLDQLRSGIREGTVASIPPIDAIVGEVRRMVVRETSPSLKRVINGTGVIIHTNLGRSLLAREAVEAITNAATNYVNLEYDLGEGTRGNRYEHCTSVLKKLTGCESALVVNNNAGAVFLVLNTLAEGKKVIISRGELVEIGGSFRIPDVMKKSGAILTEVGTTNRTYKQDYERAMGEGAGLLMKAHTSNYRIKGFVREILVEELVALGRDYSVPTYFDAGSGLLFSMSGLSSHDEPVIVEDLAKGIDIISFSGDKLPGAPQAGIIVGKTEYIDAMKRNPLARALRADKLTLAGLEATLLLYLDEKKAKTAIPTLKMLFEDKEALKKKAVRMVRILKGHSPDCAVSVAEMASEVGGGTMPDVSIPSFGITLKPARLSARQFEERLRRLEIPVIGRIEKDAFLIDMRTIRKSDEEALISGIETALANE